MLNNIVCWHSVVIGGLVVLIQSPAVGSRCSTKGRLTLSTNLEERYENYFFPDSEK
jgi:hypothetical protein